MAQISIIEKSDILKSPRFDAEYFKIKDNCRKGLLKYLKKAISIIPTIKNPEILDAGCGSGVPTLMTSNQ